MAQFGALVLLFNILPFLWSAAAADLAGTSCSTNAAACGNDVASLVQTNLAALHHGALSVESFHIMARSIKSKGAQLAMVEYGENLVRQLRAETANGTKHLDGSQEDLLAEVIVLIRTSMYTSMRDAHAADQRLLDETADDIDACNANLNASLSGAVQTAENGSDTERSDHITCRDEESVEYLYIAGNKTALDTLVGSIIAPAPSVPDQIVLTLEGVIHYFSVAQDYVDWYNLWGGAFDADKTSWDTAITSHAAKKSTCNTEQTAFETKWQRWKQLLEATCEAYCHAAKTTSYVALQSEFAPLEQNRKTAYVAGEVLVSKIECLLARNDCSNSTASAAEFTLVPRVTDEVLPCSTAAVAHGVCDEAFLNANYNAFLPADAQENKAQCSSP